MVDVCLLIQSALENRGASMSITLARGSHAPGHACTKVKRALSTHKASFTYRLRVHVTEGQKYSTEAQGEKGRSREEISRGRSRTVYDRQVLWHPMQ